MRNKSTKFQFFGIDVYVPFSGWVGLLLIAYFALPTSMNLLKAVDVTPQVLTLSLAHAVAIYFTIFIHELGHVYAARKLKYEVKGIFLHLFGGHTSFLGKYEQPGHQFWTAFAGPGFTLLVSGVAFILSNSANGVLQSVLNWLLWSSLIITMVNLLPGVPLDGGAIFSSLVWKITGDSKKGQRYAGYGGYLVALLWMISPFLLQYLIGWQITEIDIFFSAFIGVWLFISARFTVRMSKESQGLVVDQDVFNTLKVRDVARRAIAVEQDMPLGNAILLMKECEAGSILLKKDESIFGIVLEKFLLEDTQTSSRPVREFATRTDSADWINYNELIAHNEKINPNYVNGQWVVIDDEGAVFGVLHRSDISMKMSDI